MLSQVSVSSDAEGGFDAAWAKKVSDRANTEPGCGIFYALHRIKWAAVRGQYKETVRVPAKVAPDVMARLKELGYKVLYATYKIPDSGDFSFNVLWDDIAQEQISEQIDAMINR